MIYPYLLYCNVIWSHTYESYLSPLVVLQKKAVRIITSSSTHENTDPLFQTLNMLKFGDISKYSILLCFYRNFDLYINRAPHSYFTTSSESARTSYRRLDSTQRSVDFLGPKYWNVLPEDLKNLNSLDKFKRKLKMHLLKPLISFCLVFITVIAEIICNSSLN